MQVAAYFFTILVASFCLSSGVFLQNIISASRERTLLTLISGAISGMTTQVFALFIFPAKARSWA
ncbi:MAG: hypothetical protein ACI8UX_000120 [Psychromonas sp.]|jgi:hypothetical protein